MHCSSTSDDQARLRGRQRQRVVGRVPVPVGVVQVAILGRGQRIERRQRQDAAARTGMRVGDCSGRSCRNVELAFAHDPFQLDRAVGLRQRAHRLVRCARAARSSSAAAFPVCTSIVGGSARARVEGRRAAGLAREELVNQHREAEVVGGQAVLREVGDHGRGQRGPEDTARPPPAPRRGRRRSATGTARPPAPPPGLRSMPTNGPSSARRARAPACRPRAPARTRILPARARPPARAPRLRPSSGRPARRATIGSCGPPARSDARADPSSRRSPSARATRPPPAGAASAPCRRSCRVAPPGRAERRTSWMSARS